MLREPEERLHGQLRFYCEGEGQCILPNGARIGCVFCFFRYVSGHMDIFCYHNHRDSGPHPVKGDGTFDGGTIIEFVGTASQWAENGEPLQTYQSDIPIVFNTPNALVANRSFKLNANSQGISAELCTTLNAIEVSIGPQDFRFCYFRLSLVNFLFETIDNASVSLAANQDDPKTGKEIPAAPQLPLQIGDFKIYLRPAANYKEITEALWYRGGVAITAHALVIMPTEFVSQGLELHETMEEVCALLSLAKGTAIHYVELDFMDEDSEVVNRFFFHNTRLMRFGGRALTGLMGGIELKKFVETAHPILPSADEDWNLRFAIDLLTDAKAEGDLIELRGLKLANCLELLRQRFLKRTDGEFLIPAKAFDKRRKQLRAAIENTLREYLSPEQANLSAEEYEAVIGAIKENSSGLNRTSFRNALEQMMIEVGMQVASEEIRQVVAIRNQLVHQAAYDPRWGEAGEQYRFLETFVSRFLMAALQFPLPWPSPDGDIDG